MSWLLIMLCAVKSAVIYIQSSLLPVAALTLLLPQLVPRAEVQAEVQPEIKTLPEVGTILFVTSQRNAEMQHTASRPLLSAS